MFNILKNLFVCEKPSSSHLASCLTESNTAVTDEKKESVETFDVNRCQILSSSSNHYFVEDFIGEGVFGNVVKCENIITSMEVALKILKTEDNRVSKREIKMLEIVSILDPVKKNVVWFIEKFEHKGHTCLAFEMLDRSLMDLMMERREPLSPCDIRPIAQQMLTAFEALKSIGVVHADLKPDNIMLTNHLSEPFRVKLIDFGLSFTTTEKAQYCGMTIQPLGYRAPEVFLGLSISEAIDMWGLGCLLTYLFLGKHPFSINCEYQAMSGLVKILGQPADHLLSAGNNTSKFFKENKHWETPKWWLKTPIEYQSDTGIAPKKWLRTIASLDDLITRNPEMQEPIECEDLRAFVSLLKCLQHADPEKRITPEKALLHPFVTMVHLENEIDTIYYVEDSSEKMLVCQMEGSKEELLLEGIADRETEGETHSAAPFTNGPVATQTTGELLATPRSSDGMTNLPLSNVGAATSGVVEASAPVEEESLVSQGPAMEMLPNDESLDEGFYNSSENILVCQTEHSEVELHLKDMGDRETEGEILSAILCAIGTGLVAPGTTVESLDTPRSSKAMTNLPLSNVGAATSGVVDSSSSTEKESVASQGPAKEISPNDESPDEGFYDSCKKRLFCQKEDLQVELHLKDMGDKETGGEKPPVIFCEIGTGLAATGTTVELLATPRSSNGMTNLPLSNVGAATSGVVEASAPVEEESVVSQGPAMEMLPNDGSLDEGFYNSSEKISVCQREHSEVELHLKDMGDRETEGEILLAILCAIGTGLVTTGTTVESLDTPRSSKAMTNLPLSNVGAATSGVVDSSSSTEKESVVSQGPAKEISPNCESPDEGFYDSCKKRLFCQKEDLEVELHLKDMGDKETEGEILSVIFCEIGTGLAATGTTGERFATPRSSDGMTNLPLSNVGAATSGVVDASARAKEELVVSQGPAKDVSPNDGFPDTMLVCKIKDSEEDLPLKNKGDEEGDGKMPSVLPGTNGDTSAILTSGTGTATRRCSDCLTNMPSSNVGPAATQVEDTIDSTEVDSAVSQVSIVAADKLLPNDGPPDEGPPVKVKNGRLKRIRKFFGRTIRTFFVQKH